jgi:hypothetical protein
MQCERDGMEQDAVGANRVVSGITQVTVSHARFGYQLTVTGPDAADVLLDASRAAIQKHGGVINGDTPMSVVADFGSASTLRTIGALFTPRSKWPVTLVCEIVPGAQPALRLTTSEAFGFGTLVGIEGKFRERCQEVLRDVSAEVMTRLAAGAVS